MKGPGMRLIFPMITMILVMSLSIGCAGRNAGERTSPAEHETTAKAASTAEKTPTAELENTAVDAMETTSVVEDTIASDDTPTAQQYQALLAKYEAEGGTRIFAKRFLELAEQNPQDAAAAEALLWVVRNVLGKADTTRALELLKLHHVESEKLGPAGKHIAGSRSIAAEKLLRAVFEENPHEQVRAQACYYLASLWGLEVGLVEQLKNQPELAPRVLQYYGKDYGEHLASLELPVLEKQRERLYEQMRDTFPDVELDGVAMGELAEKMLFRIRHLSVGKVAPEIDGEDIDGNKFKLSDYRGKVVMLTFWGHW
jgi:hypothetical protein